MPSRPRVLAARRLTDALYAAGAVAVDSLQERSERVARTTWLGGPPDQFEPVGRLGFQLLMREGLRPSSRVLDVGCGALRLGYWLMRFLDPGCYFGIEPQQDMLRVGLEQLVEPQVVERAGAHFSANDDFDFSVFDETFDFVVARSIWTHASKAQISAMLGSFAANSSPGALFLTSYKPASAAALAGRIWAPAERAATVLSLAALSPAVARRWPAIGPSFDYQGNTWVGRSDSSTTAGVVRHRFSWIAAEAQRHNLAVRQLPYAVANHQFWLRIEHA